jgi:hypothetical protein
MRPFEEHQMEDNGKKGLQVFHHGHCCSGMIPTWVLRICCRQLRIQDNSPQPPEYATDPLVVVTPPVYKTTANKGSEILF